MTHVHGKGLIEQNRYTSVPGSPQKLYRGRWASREKRIEAHWQHTGKCVQCICKSYLWKQVSAHNSFSSQRRQLAALSCTKLSLELLLMSSGEKVLCWEAQHCKQWGAYPWCPKVLPLSCCCFVFSVFCSSACQESSAEKDIQKREIFISEADWCAYLAMVFSATAWSWVVHLSLQMKKWDTHLQVNGQLTWPCFPGEWFQTSALPNPEHGLGH